MPTTTLEHDRMDASELADVLAEVEDSFTLTRGGAMGGMLGLGLAVAGLGLSVLWASTFFAVVDAALVVYWLVWFDRNVAVCLTPHDPASIERQLNDLGVESDD